MEAQIKALRKQYDQYGCELPIQLSPLGEAKVAFTRDKCDLCRNHTQLYRYRHVGVDVHKRSITVTKIYKLCTLCYQLMHPLFIFQHPHLDELQRQFYQLAGEHIPFQAIYSTAYAMVVLMRAISLYTLLPGTPIQPRLLTSYPTGN